MVTELEYLAAALSPSVLFSMWLGVAPDDWQADALESLLDPMASRREAWTTCRQAGKSSTAAVAVAWEAMFRPGSLTLLLAPTEAQAVEVVMLKVKGVLAKMGEVPTEESQTRLVLPNGSRVLVLAGSAPENARGHAADLIVVDEAAQTTDDLWHAVAPETVVTRGRVLALTSAWQKRGWYWEMWNDPEAQWVKREKFADDLPRIMDNIESVRADFKGSDREFRREMFGEWMEDGEAVWNPEDLDDMFGYEDEIGAVQP